MKYIFCLCYTCRYTELGIVHSTQLGTTNALYKNYERKRNTSFRKLNRERTSSQNDTCIPKYHEAMCSILASPFNDFSQYNTSGKVCMQMSLFYSSCKMSIICIFISVLLQNENIHKIKFKMLDFSTTLKIVRKYLFDVANLMVNRKKTRRF